MAAVEGSAPLAASRRRAHSERLAIWRLEAALAEQARLGDALALAAGTSAEQPCYVRLAAASLHVSLCDRAVKTLTTPDG
jgi:hypothetical protein